MPMITAVGTSILVAGVLSWHEQHTASQRELEALAQPESTPMLPAHALVECYSVLARLPTPHRIAASDAHALLSGSFASWPVAGTANDVWDLLAHLADNDIIGGMVYDTLIVASALAAGADEIVTWKLSLFERVAHGRLIVRQPR